MGAEDLVAKACIFSEVILCVDSYYHSRECWNSKSLSTSPFLVLSKSSAVHIL